MNKKWLILAVCAVLCAGLLVSGCKMNPKYGRYGLDGSVPRGGTASRPFGFGSSSSPSSKPGSSSSSGSRWTNSAASHIVTQLKTVSRTDLSGLASLSNKKTGWGAGFGKNGQQPVIPKFQRDLFEKYNAYCIGSADSKSVYLTFDLGYESGTTPALLDILKEKNAKAVFFITMHYAKKNPELVNRMLKEGHVVGNHSCKHPSFPDIDLTRLEAEVMDLHDYVKQHFGYEMTLFRLPKGEYSERSLAAVDKLGYVNVLWSFGYLDYDENNQKGADYAYKKITDNLHNGAILLLHPESTDNIKAMPRVIDTIRARGFELTLLTGKPQ